MDLDLSVCVPLDPAHDAAGFSQWSDWCNVLPEQLSAPSQCSKASSTKKRKSGPVAEWRKYGEKAIQPPHEMEDQIKRCYFKCNAKNCPCRVSVDLVAAHVQSVRVLRPHAEQCAHQEWPPCVTDVEAARRTVRPGADRAPAQRKTTRVPKLIRTPYPHNAATVVCVRASATDFHGKYLLEQACSGFKRITGYTLAECRGRTLSFLQGPETNPTDIAVLAAGIRSREQTSVPLCNYAKDGTSYMVLVSVSPDVDRADVMFGCMIRL